MTFLFCLSRRASLLSCISWIVTAGFLPVVFAFGESPTCPVVAASDPAPAQIAYAEGRYSQAEALYGDALGVHPQDAQLSAFLVSTLLREGQVGRAAAQASESLTQHPNSAVALTSLAEVQLRQGQPWLTIETLKSAAAADPCYARAHLVHAKVLRIDSMYASERDEIRSAYAIDPSDPDIHHAWLTTVEPANEIEAVTKSLATMKDLDAVSRQRAEDSIRSMRSLLWENNQTCQVLPAVEAASFALQTSYQDPKHIDGYQIDVDLPKSKGKLRIDTAASGLFISRVLADVNGLQPVPGDPSGTVHVDSVRIGVLEFRDCVVGVTDKPFPGKVDGFIGTDMFAPWLITLDHPGAKLILAPLPIQKGVLPGDRVAAPELQNFIPVYHRQHYLLPAVDINEKTRSLFMLDSGLRFSAMTPEVAHAVSNTKVNFTNSMQTASGSMLQVYRDSFNFHFASLTLTHQNHIMEMDSPVTSQNAGIGVAGKLGFDMLHSLVMHLDYRDGLIKLESSDAEVSSGKGTMIAKGATVEEKPACGPEDKRDRPVGTTIIGKVTGVLDSAHLKPGKEINVQVMTDWLVSECSLASGSILYGHVTAARGLKAPVPSELSFVFDQAECGGGRKKPVSLIVIGLVASPDQFVGLHNVMPLEVHGLRNISQSVASLGLSALDENLNPGGIPHTIHPGIVAGIPKMTLEPQGGPECSTRLSSTDHAVRLGVGTELILTMLKMP